MYVTVAKLQFVRPKIKTQYYSQWLRNNKWPYKVDFVTEFGSAVMFITIRRAFLQIECLFVGEI